MAATCMVYDERLKGDIQAVRRKGAIFGGNSTSGSGSGTGNGGSGRRRCGRCRGELGRIINRGLCCPGCRLRVCKSCRQYLEHSPSVQWLCTLCQYHLEEKTATGEWMKEFVNETNKDGANRINTTETLKRSIQRSWTFSDVSPSPWSFLRGSPEMRAYSSMPRHQDCEFLYSTDFTKPSPLSPNNESIDLKENEPQNEKELHLPKDDQIHSINEQINSADDEIKDKQAMIQSELQLELSKNLRTITESSDDSINNNNNCSMNDDNENRLLTRSPIASRSLSSSQQREPTPSPTAQLFRKVALRIDARNLPPGVTPPRSRRRLLTSADIHLTEDIIDTSHHALIEGNGKVLVPDSEGYKLVYISSSDSSSREELHSDDGCCLDRSGGELSSEDCDWDYFECWQGGGGNSRLRIAGYNNSGDIDGSTVAHDRLPQLAGLPVDSAELAGSVTTSSVSKQCASCPNLVPLHVPIPVPFPVPVPVFFPVPISVTTARHGEMMTTRLLPNSETLPLDELLCNKALSPLITEKEEEKLHRNGSEDSVVLKHYKSLDITDNVPSSAAPEGMLRLTEAKLSDFTEFRDDNSDSSVTSDEENECRTPSTRIYTLNKCSSEEADEEGGEDEEEIESSEEFSIAVTPPRSLSSCSSSSNSSTSSTCSHNERKSFKRTYVLCRTDSESEIDDEIEKENLENNLKKIEKFEERISNKDTVYKEGLLSDSITIKNNKNNNNKSEVLGGDDVSLLSCINRDSGGSEQQQDLDTTTNGGLGGLLSSGAAATKLLATAVLQPDITAFERRPQNLHDSITLSCSAITTNDIIKTCDLTIKEKSLIRTVEDTMEDDDEEEEGQLATSQTESLIEKTGSTTEHSNYTEGKHNEINCNGKSITLSEIIISSEDKKENISDNLLLSEFSTSDKNISSSDTVINELHESAEPIKSIITFSNVEVLQVCCEFLESEKKFNNTCIDENGGGTVCAEIPIGGTMVGITEKKMVPATTSVGPENTSDEFSGTESMEMPLEDSLERSAEERGEVPASNEPVEATTCVSESGVQSAAGKYTSLVMITQQEQNNSTPLTSMDEDKSTESVGEMVRVVTGANTLSNVVCLEEGLADDDSWVEDLDRDEAVTTTEESSEEEAFPDREEELRGYHRSAIDFTLHTIAEESCEESEVEAEKNKPTELEKYFFYGLGDNVGTREEPEVDTMSETSSIYSGGVESNGGGNEETADGARTPEEDGSNDPVSSRLEKYFLVHFKGFNRRDSDGSVGSDSEGRPSPEQRRKRLVRARGTGRQHSSSLDNLTDTQADTNAQGDIQNETDGFSTETDSLDELVTSFDKVDGQFDTVKRTKKKKRSVPSMAGNDLLEVPENYQSGSKEDLNHSTDDGGGKKTPRACTPPSELARNKQQSRDSGFVGSCDDLLKDSRENNIEAQIKSEEKKNPPEPIAELMPPSAAALSRKDSFNNWSSDEETNLMMSKMRAFFKTMVGSQPKGASPNLKPKTKPPQLVYFESELTRLMKTVPGIREEQVREIVEYLSSEDTWSDSYDSSDYTSSDLENSNKRSAIQEEISASCRQIISNFESGGGVTTVVDDIKPSEISQQPEQNKDSAFVYQRLVASFNRIEAPKCDNAAQNSPPLIEKVMQHIGTRLWALMHEVSGGEGSSPRIGARYHKRLASKLSATSTTEEEEEEEEEEAEEEEIDCVEDYSPLPRSKSHDPLLEENRQEASDNERFSWRGSFESALMASDSRTRLAESGVISSSQLALAAKRRSAGDLMFKSFSREQLDRVRSCGSIGGSVEDKIWTRQKRRRSSVPDSAAGSGGSGGSADGEEDSDCGGTGLPSTASDRATLPRSLQASSVGSVVAAATNSLPRLPTTPVPPQNTIYKSHSVHQFIVKSARYRPPGYRGSPVAPPPRRDRRARSQTASQSSLSTACDDASICSEPIGRAAEEEVDRLLNQHRATSLGDFLEKIFGRTFGKSKKLSESARSDSLASVYSGAGEGRHVGVTVRGEVQFGLQYNYKQSCLEIHVKQCKDLAPVDIKRNRSDPYVKVYLLPDKSKSGKRKTRVKKHTLNPIFDEVLKFQVSLEGLEHRTLWLSVWHSDMFGRNDFLGEVLMPLENKVFDDPNYKFYTLQERSEMLEDLNCRGELIVGLKYETPDENSQSKKRPSKGCLYVLIKEAKNLPAVKSNGSSDPFCKSYLLPDKGRSSKQKAPVIRRTCNPAWHHTFTYHNISLDELSERSLELTIWDHDRLASNEFLGGVRLNMGTGKHQGKAVDWMDANGNEITLWQRMIEKPNFWVESCLSLRPTLDLRTNSLT